MRKPTEREITEELKKTKTDSISPSWIQSCFKLSYHHSKELFIKMQDMGLINHEGVIKIDQYHNDAEF